MISQVSLLEVVAVLAAGLIAAAVVSRRSMAAAFVLACAFIPYPVSFVGKSPFGIVTAVGLFGVALIAYIFLQRNHDGLDGSLHRMAYSHVLFSVVIATSALLSHESFRGTSNAARTQIVAIVGCFWVGRFFATREEGALSTAMVACGVIGAAAAVEQVFRVDVASTILPAQLHFPLVDPGPSFRYGLVRSRLGFYHASELGRLLVVAFALVIGSTARGSNRRLWLGVAMTAGLIATLTFQAWAAAAIAILVLVAVLPGARVRLAVGLAATLAVASFGIFPPATRLIEGRIDPSGSDLAEYRLRAALVPVSVDRAVHGPFFGSGPGTFNLQNLTAVIEGKRTVLVGDSTYATLLVETGAPGLIAFLALAGAALAYFYERRHQPVAGAAFGGLVGWLFIGLAVDLLASDQALAAVWLLIGLAAGSTKAIETSKPGLVSEAASG